MGNSYTASGSSNSGRAYRQANAITLNFFGPVDSKIEVFLLAPRPSVFIGQVNALNFWLSQVDSPIESTRLQYKYTDNHTNSNSKVFIQKGNLRRTSKYSYSYT